LISFSFHSQSAFSLFMSFSHSTSKVKVP